MGFKPKGVVGGPLLPPAAPIRPVQILARAQRGHHAHHAHTRRGCCWSSCWCSRGHCGRATRWSDSRPASSPTTSGPTGPSGLPTLASSPTDIKPFPDSASPEADPRARSTTLRSAHASRMRRGRHTMMPLGTRPGLPIKPGMRATPLCAHGESRLLLIHSSFCLLNTTASSAVRPYAGHV